MKILAKYWRQKSEEAIFMLKPDGMNLESEILEIFKHLQIEILNQKNYLFNKETLQNFYSHGEMRHNPEFIEYMCSGTVLAYHVQGVGAIKACLKLREDIRSGKEAVLPKNLVHAADNYLEAARELRIIFG